MKKFLGTTMLALITFIATAQPSKSLVQGTVTETSSKTPIAGATISLGNRKTVTDEQGTFSFSKVNKGVYELIVNSLGFKDAKQTVTANGTDIKLGVQLTATALFLQPLEVKSVRASDKAPFVKTNISKEDIAKANLGQDILL